MEEHESRKSLRSIIKDAELENLIVVPPDGGWGWVVVAASFSSCMIADGILYTFGIFLEELSRSFGVTIGNVTMVGSIMTCFYYLVGPFVSALLNRFGFRFVAIIGSVTAASGIALGTLCEKFPLFVVCTGVITGVGLGMITTPAVIIVGYYFEKWRALATGIATCGSGTGTLLTPPFVTFLLQRLDWRNTYRILACFLLSTGVVAIFYRPLMPVKVIQDEKEIQIIEQTDSIGSFEMETTKCCQCNFRRHHNTNYPTTADIFPIETVMLEMPDRSDETSSLSYTTCNVVSSFPSATQNTGQLTNAVSRDLHEESRCKLCWHKFLKIICCGHWQTVSRPMYRDDIFFGHSLMLLTQYKESIANQRQRKQKMRQTQTTSRGLPKPRSTGYHMSVTRVTTHRDVYGSGDNKVKCTCHMAVLRTLSTMLDFRLLKSPAFQVFTWSGMFIVFGYMIPYLYIKNRAIEHGIAPHVAFWLLSAIGGANTVGRIISGILPSVMNLKVLEYSFCCIVIAGVMTMFSGFSMAVEFQFFYATLYGMAASCVATLRPVIIVELFGLEHLTNAYGLQLMFMGVAGFCGTMIAGIVYDYTQDYNAAFYISGSCLIVSAIFLIFTRKIRVYEKKHNSAEAI